MSEEWKAQYDKIRPTLVFVGRCSGKPRGNPWSQITPLRFVGLPSSWPLSQVGFLTQAPGSILKHIYGFRKMVTITLYARQKKRHRGIEQSFGFWGRGWDDLEVWHWNMYNILYEMNRQSRFDAWYWMLGAGALRRPRGMVQGGRREQGSGWGTRVCPWQIHVDVWQNQYNIVK